MSPQGPANLSLESPHVTWLSFGTHGTHPTTGTSSGLSTHTVILGYCLFFIKDLKKIRRLFSPVGSIESYFGFQGFFYTFTDSLRKFYIFSKNNPHENQLIKSVDLENSPFRGQSDSQHWPCTLKFTGPSRGLCISGTLVQGIHYNN